MADCKKYNEMISSYADGELSGNEKSRLERHLDECPSCRSLLALYKSIAEASAESLVEPPENFTESIMSEIKNLPDNGFAADGAMNKKKKSIRPVVISFVAAAACLVLAFIVSPELFGLRSGSNMSASAPMASPAPSAAFKAVIEETPADEEMQYGTMKSADSAPEASAAADANAGTPTATTDTGAGSAPQAEIGITQATGIPTPAPSLVPSYATAGRGDQEILKAYFEIFIIEGQLPEVLKAYSMTDNGDGTFDIVISMETAAQLAESGFVPEQGAQDAKNALVIYTPGE